MKECIRRNECHRGSDRPRLEGDKIGFSVGGYVRVLTTVGHDGK